MKKLLGCIRRADEDFGLIKSGDRVLVGVSGGKDSLALLVGLSTYRMFSKKNYELIAGTLTMGLEPFDLTGVRKLCDELGVPYHVRETRIGPIVFEERKEKNPCSLCAIMRRGALNKMAAALGCNKVALGHHRDDAIETLLLSLFYESRLHTFAPLTHLSRTGLTQIRPLVYVPEKNIRGFARRYELPVVPSPCPANGNTQRQAMKDLLADLSRRFPDVRERMLSALQNEEQYGLWPKPKSGD